MIFVPLPFVVTLLMVIMLVAVVRRDDERPLNIPFLALIALTALQSFLIGLRLGYGVEWPRLVSPVIASVIPAFLFQGALNLAGPRRQASVASVAPHALAPALVIGAMLVLPAVLDVAIISVFVIYAILILSLLRTGADSLRLAALDGAGAAHQALVLAATVLLFSAAVDAFISFDVAYMDARHLPAAVTFGNLATLLFLSLTAAAASRSRAPSSSHGETVAAQETHQAPDDAPAETGDPETMAVIEALMTQKRVFLDPDLNLDRLSRKALIPSRQISAAINRTAGKNVSQYVNDFRIAEACQRLAVGGASVTEVMFEAGFQTKSNFNREFRRVTGTTPQEWRKARTRERPSAGD
jgi:AraC-like DNA-binding protein